MSRQWVSAELSSFQNSKLKGSGKKRSGPCFKQVINVKISLSIRPSCPSSKKFPLIRLLKGNLPNTSSRYDDLALRKHPHQYDPQSAALGGLSANFNLFLPSNASSTNKVSPRLLYNLGLPFNAPYSCSAQPVRLPYLFI